MFAMTTNLFDFGVRRFIAAFFPRTMYYLSGRPGAGYSGKNCREGRYTEEQKAVMNRRTPRV